MSLRHGHLESFVILSDFLTRDTDGRRFVKRVGWRWGAEHSAVSQIPVLLDYGGVQAPLSWRSHAVISFLVDIFT